MLSENVTTLRGPVPPPALTAGAGSIAVETRPESRYNREFEEENRLEQMMFEAMKCRRLFADEDL